LHLPFPGFSHEDRALLALSVHLRYDRHAEIGPVARLLLDEETRTRARVIGTSLRLAHTICGGIPGFLGRTALKVGKKRLTLVLPADGDTFDGEVIERRLQAVARTLGLEGRVARNKR
jgi:exopolyphosphatase/guanosine-5'-triphosphate,3'-diphosphate pyrophosphatase